MEFTLRVPEADKLIQSGNILETLKGVDGIGSDFKLSVGYCGKGGQTAPVGDGGPHTRILNAMVGGSN